MNSSLSSLSILLTHNNDSVIAPSNDAVDSGCCPEAADKINHDSFGALMRYDKIENARSSTIREQRQQEHQTVALTSTKSIMRNALLERLEAKLLDNTMEFTELERLVDAWKGGVPAALLLLYLDWEPEKVSGLKDENDVFEKFETLLLIKENECRKFRNLLAEARKEKSSTLWNPEDTSVCSSVPLFIDVNANPLGFQIELQ
jgi:hypothetical protein